MLILPLGLLLHASLPLERWEAPPQYTLENYRANLASPSNLRVLLNTLIVAGGATLVASIAGIPLAWLTARTDMPGAQVLTNDRVEDTLLGRTRAAGSRAYGWPASKMCAEHSGARPGASPRKGCAIRALAQEFSRHADEVFPHYSKGAAGAMPKIRDTPKHPPRRAHPKSHPREPEDQPHARANPLRLPRPR